MKPPRSNSSKKGGNQTKKRYGKEFYAAIGKKGGQAKRKLPPKE